MLKLPVQGFKGLVPVQWFFLKYCMKSEKFSSDLLSVADEKTHVLKKHESSALI
jgi:hypothetical protein